MVLLNAAAGLIAAGKTQAWPEALDLARASLDTGNAAGVLDRLVRTSQAVKRTQPA